MAVGLVAVVAACGGSGDGEGDVAAFCEGAGEAVAAVSDGSSGDAIAAVEALVDEAPAEVAAVLDDVLEGVRAERDLDDATGATTDASGTVDAAAVAAAMEDVQRGLGPAMDRFRSIVDEMCEGG